ncbi:MAG: ribonuclease III [Defluviitaleaceae bacterium]|nr:ribonuclease III [Defluviitaleaceae bacterium]
MDSSLLNYEFNDNILLELALTHSSFSNENNLPASNQRLEFLGDAVLELVISDMLYCSYPEMDEGELTKLRASIVCEPSLCEVAKNISLGKRILLGNGEEMSGGRERGSILSDALEAVIGAIYLDGGLESVREFIRSNFSDKLESGAAQGFEADYKSRLQEIVQNRSKSTIVYKIVAEEGPDHDKRFTAEAVKDTRVVGRGGGKTKKDAEQQAALAALKRMGLA